MFNAYRVRRHLETLKGAVDPAQRCRAAHALGRLGEASAVPTLVSTLGDVSPEVRRAAANSLAALGSPKWQAWVQGDVEDFQRLGRSQEPHAVEPLLRALEHPESAVQASVVLALGELGNPAAIEPLVGLLGRVCGATAARSLGCFGSRVFQPLLRVLHGGPPDACKRAIEVLAEIQCSDAAEPFIGLLRHSDPGVRSAAAVGLGALAVDRAVPALIELLRDGEDCCRVASARSLGRIRDSRAVLPLLLRVLSGESAEMAIAATAALGEIGDTHIAGVLLLMLGDGRLEIRRAAADALRKLGEPAWLDWVEEIPRSASRCEPGFRARILPLLMHALSQRPARDRIAVLEWLGEIREPQTFQTLMRTLGDPDPAVQRAAALATSQFAAEAFDPLRYVLAEGDAVSQRGAAEALGLLGDVRAVESLVELRRRCDSRLQVRPALEEARPLTAIRDACDGAIKQLSEGRADYGGAG